MKYLDIFYQVLGTEYGYIPRHKVLAWTVNHEHAVFHILDDVHPATVVVWFQWEMYSNDVTWEKVNTIHKFERKDDKWRYAEPLSRGEIPLVNNNPFDPRKENAASNTAESVFPQNQ